MHFSAFELVVKLISKFINQLKVKQATPTQVKYKIKLEPAGITGAAQPQPKNVQNVKHSIKLYRTVPKRDRERGGGATRVEQKHVCLLS